MPDDLIGQFRDFVDMQNSLIRSGACLLTGATRNEDYTQYLDLVHHVEELWSAACVLFKSRLYPPSLFLAITTIEEIGKIGVARFQMVLRDTSRRSGVPLQIAETSRRENPFFRHDKKHLLAAGAGALINSRLRRIVGEAAVTRFLKQVQAGEVRKLRESALYADIDLAGPILPNATTRAEDAKVYVILAGELMAEVLGFEVDEFERLLGLVQDFEKSIGHAWE